MEALQPRYSEADVLRCLEQSAIVLDAILAHGQQGFERLPMAEQRAALRDLTVICNVLDFLRRHVVPSLLADSKARSLLSQRPAAELLTRISTQARALELRFSAPPPTLN